MPPVRLPILLSRIDVLDADAGTAQPIAAFEAAQLETMLQPLGSKTLSDPKDRLVIADGQSAIAFMSVAFDRGSHIPDRLGFPFHTAIAHLVKTVHAGFGAAGRTAPEPLKCIHLVAQGNDELRAPW